MDNRYYLADSSSNVYFAKAIWDRYGSTGRKQEYSDFLHKELHLGQTKRGL